MENQFLIPRILINSEEANEISFEANETFETIEVIFNGVKQISLENEKSILIVCY